MKVTPLSLVLIFISAISFNVRAEDEQPAHFRLFGGNAWINPTQLNKELKAGGIHEVANAGMYGIEGTFGKGILNYGARIQGMYIRAKEIADPSASPSNPYYGSFERFDGMAIGRINIVNTSFFKFDTVAGVGLSGITSDVRTSAGEGTYKSPTNSNLVTLAGASVGIGFSSIYLFIEGGQQWNKASGFKGSGKTSTALKEIDSSGAYVLVGIDCSHIPGIKFSKTK
jgi:hypothetical protein